MQVSRQLLPADLGSLRRLRGRLACVWSTLLEPKYRARLRGAMTNEVRTMWLLRQIYFGRLVGLGYNPMLLDADVILFRDPLALIAAVLPGYAARNYLAQIFRCAIL